MNVHSFRNEFIVNKREKIIRKAREVIARKGYQNASIKEIARRAGVAQGTPYLYFRNKEELFFEMILSLVRDIDEKIDRAVKLEVDFWDKLNYLVRELGIHFKKNRDIANMIHNVLNEPHGLSKRVLAQLGRIQDLRMKKVDNIFRMLKKDSAGIKDFSDKEVARFCEIAIEGMIKRITDGIEEDPAETSDFIVKCLKSAFRNKR